MNNANLENLKIRTRKKRKTDSKYDIGSRDRLESGLWDPGQAGFKMGLFLSASLSPHLEYSLPYLDGAIILE